MTNESNGSIWTIVKCDFTLEKRLGFNQQTLDIGVDSLANLPQSAKHALFLSSRTWPNVMRHESCQR